MNKLSLSQKILTTAITIMTLLGQTVYSLPTDPAVEEGSAIIEVSGGTMTINASDKAIINYSSFNIGTGESVIITLPGASSSILNRDVGGNFSNLAGMLQCNGLFILINPAGIYVAPTASLNAGSVVLSTRDINSRDFLDSKFVFRKVSAQELDSLLVNAGTINISNGGFGVLISGAIENSGTITAPIGRIHLASGDAIRLDISNNGLVSVAIEEKAAGTVYDFQGRPITEAIKNTGLLNAEGGIVTLDAQSITGIFTKAINLSGNISADELKVHSNGEISLSAAVRVRKSEYDAPKTVLNGAGSYNFYGDVTVLDFECIVPGREIYFEPGKIFTVLGNLKVKGAYAELVKLVSAEDGRQWFIDPRGIRDLEYVWVKDSYNLSDKKIVMTNSSGRGNNFNWDPTVYWWGTTSDLWSVGTNWSTGVTPGADDDVIFNAAQGSGRLTTVVDSDFYINSCTVTDWGGTSMTFRANLTVDGGNIVNHSVPIIIDPSNAAADDIIIENVFTGGSIELANWGSTITLNNGANLVVRASNGTIGLGDVHGTGAKDLTVNAGTGNIFIGSIGTALGDNINAVSLAGAEAHLYNNIITGSAAGSTFNASGTVYLEGDITIDTSASDGDISLGTIRGAGSHRDLAVNAGGNVFVGTIGAGDEINTVEIEATEIHLYGNITTSNAVGNTVTLEGTVKVENDLTIDTDTAGADGSIAIDGKIDSSGGSARNLTLTSGSADITVTGAIGSSSALSSFTATGDEISLANIGTSGAAGVTGDTSVTGVTAVTLAGTNYNANKQTYDPTGDDLNISGNAATTFTSSGDDILFQGTIHLSNGSDLIVNTAGGNVSLGTLRGTSSENVTVNAGSGTIYAGQIGSGNEIHTVGLAGGQVHLFGNITTSNLASNNVNIAGAVQVRNALTINTGANNGAVTMNAGTTTLSDGADLTITTGGGNVALGAVRGTSSEDLSVNAGAGAVSVGAIGSGDEINTVSLSGGTITLAGNITTSNAAGNTVTLTGNTQLASDVTIDTNTAGSDGAITITGTLDSSGSNRNLALDSGSANISVTGAVGGNLALNSLDILSANTAGFGGNVTLAGSLSVGAGVIVNAANGSTWTIGGNWTNNGTFNAGTSNVIFAGGGTSTISGNDNNFNNLTCTTAGKTLSFQSGSTQTLTGALTLTGAANNYLTLSRSGGAGVDQWTIDPQGAASVSYVNISNSNNAGPAVTAQNSIDGGNNTNWIIIAPPAPPAPQKQDESSLTSSNSYERDTTPGRNNPGSTIINTLYPAASKDVAILIAANAVNIVEERGE
ncbi:MAG: filamentous hemagglutinin N-terminal domain-containing protein [Candidatus Omnitrophica bacterium]|nr:filamentous hemagglutinin N-terminal domain-containing protein [Candidatus Omnitrophota bacterium]